MRGKGSGQFELAKDANKSFQTYKFGESKFYIVNENVKSRI